MKTNFDSKQTASLGSSLLGNDSGGVHLKVFYGGVDGGTGYFGAF